MDDLISRQAAIDAMTNTLWHYPNECYRNLNEYEFAKGLSELGLKSVPPAQPEIIRCKDCKYRDENWRRVSVRWLPCMDMKTGSNWYCGSAERGEQNER